MTRKEVQVVALSSSETSTGNFVLVLEDIVAKKRMAITIGIFEAQSIAIYMERMQLPRPLTFDIFKIVIEELGAKLKEVEIYNIIDGVFYAWIILDTQNKEYKKIDARVSDAVALAIRFNCPIFVNDLVLDQAILEEPNKLNSYLKSSLLEYSIVELEDLLKNILAKEDYESASRIRDIINKRISER